MNRMSINVQVGFILILTALCSHLLPAQSACSPAVVRAWIEAEDGRGQHDTLWFGFDPAATCGVDAALCEVEPTEICGPPNDLACFAWYVPECGSPDGHLLYRHNYRKLFTQSQIDTFALSFFGEFPFTFRWSPESVQKVADSVVMRDGLGVNILKIRMDLEDSAVVSAIFHDLLIISYRSGITGMSNRGEEAPMASSLQQNYPNPFNPSTTISYTLSAQCLVTLKVFNVLGQELATLVNGIETPGSKSVRFDGSGLPSGVYFYRLQAGSYSGTKMLMIVK